jgi:hypothetical protein
MISFYRPEFLIILRLNTFALIKNISNVYYMILNCKKVITDRGFVVKVA